MGSHLRQFFKQLSASEEAEYRRQARKSWKYNRCHFKEYVHPVVKDEWDKLDLMLETVKKAIKEQQAIRKIKLDSERIMELNKRLDGVSWYKFW